MGYTVYVDIILRPFSCTFLEQNVSTMSPIKLTIDLQKNDTGSRDNIGLLGLSDTLKLDNTKMQELSDAVDAKIDLFLSSDLFKFNGRLSKSIPKLDLNIWIKKNGSNGEAGKRAHRVIMALWLI